eukprot:scaffold109955_cov27-Tisochrysis_lutea.AAC.1
MPGRWKHTHPVPCLCLDRQAHSARCSPPGQRELCSAAKSVSPSPSPESPPVSPMLSAVLEAPNPPPSQDSSPV